MSKVIYTQEIKEHILSEHEAGVAIRELARRYEPSATTIQNWKRQAKAKANAPETDRSQATAELRRCRRRIEQLEQENAFLKKPRPGLPPTARPLVVPPGVPPDRSRAQELHGASDVSGARDIRVRLLQLAPA